MKRSKQSSLFLPLCYSIITSLILSACSSNPNAGRYSMKNDAYPDKTLNPHEIEDAVPQKVTRTKAGNKSPYTVLGKTYYVMKDTKGFTQTGGASWYGKKFHGHQTSNGEIYDMYKMTAAHKTLPIPTYVRVTNLDNNLSTVVRVNDRGPFHGGRIIDLSYAAATKLGYVNKGTARVRIEALEPGEKYNVVEAAKTPPSQPAAPAAAEPKPVAVINPVNPPPNSSPDNPDNYHLPSNTYLQVAAFGSEATARQTRDKLQSMTGYPVGIKQVDNLFKVRIGPVTDNFDLLDLRELVIASELGNPVVIYD